jgi:integral membrane sensor domain MASE1
LGALVVEAWFPLRLAACFVLVTFATAFVGFKAHNTLIWVANGLLLSYMLLAPRWRWPGYLAAGFAAQLVGSQLVYPNFTTNLSISALNIAAVYMSALLLRRRSNQLPRFSNRRYLIRFFLVAVLATPMASGAIFAVFSTTWVHTAPLRAFELWSVCGGLGAAIATPAFVAIFIARFRSAVNWRSDWIYLVLLGAVTIVGFVQFKLPVLFLYYPLLILVLMRLGLAWQPWALSLPRPWEQG